ncbi:MAG: hypothetical protein KKF46_06030 [Nanoarchaeota archaeon]|nr:hypothetical protein [Nanoarchaeota archaeon]MBU1321891.1 hypothetical protein [Nanoarchaeota archaeon]MBU1597666.1 hypothetical protein [Nanoarchaeota archaeon]MBU2442229.1 hypothetical protein [Nanoarchaeota archaeon]
MKINQKINKNDLVNIKVACYKNKFRFTIPVSQIRKINAKSNDFIKIIIVKDSCFYQYYVRTPNKPKSRKNLQVRRTVPKKFVEKSYLKAGDIISLKLSLVRNIRTDELIKNYYLDLLAAIPRKTKSNKTIMVEVFNKNKEEWLNIWCCSGQGGNMKSIKLKRFIQINRELGEFFGLMQAESSKNGVRFDFTIKFLNQIKLFRNVSKNFGISESDWRWILFHRSEIDDSLLMNYKKKFSAALNIDTKNISLIKNKHILDVVHSMYIPNTLLGQIMVTILTRLRKYISEKTILNTYLKDFATGFIIKYLLGDGTVILMKNSGLNVFISEGNILLHQDIRNILKLLNINSSSQNIKIHLSTNFKSCIWFIENKAFLEHKENRRKLLQYFLSNYYSNLLYERLRLLYSSITIVEFADILYLSRYAAQKYLNDNVLRGFIDKIKEHKFLKFKISQKGKYFIQLMNSAKKELSAFNDSKRN